MPSVKAMGKCITLHFFIASTVMVSKNSFLSASSMLIPDDINSCLFALNVILAFLSKNLPTRPLATLINNIRIASQGNMALKCTPACTRSKTEPLCFFNSCLSSVKQNTSAP